MSLIASFTRNPVSGGDNNAWAAYLMVQACRGGLGSNSIDVTNVAGALTIGLGYAGIDDGVTQGTIQVTTAGTVSLAGSTAGAWHALECSVSGATATFYLTAMGSYTDESFMDLAMKGYYDAAKCGYYRIASRRTLAFVFVRAGTVLGRVVNTENGIKGFKGIPRIDYYDNTGALSQKYIDKVKVQSSAWNMDTTTNIIVTLPFGITTWQNAYAIIIQGALMTPLNIPQIDSGYMNGGVGRNSANQAVLYRYTGGAFDSALYNNALSYVTIEYET